MCAMMFDLKKSCVHFSPKKHLNQLIFTDSARLVFRAGPRQMGRPVVYAATGDATLTAMAVQALLREDPGYSAEDRGDSGR